MTKRAVMPPVHLSFVDVSGAGNWVIPTLYICTRGILAINQVNLLRATVQCVHDCEGLELGNKDNQGIRGCTSPPEVESEGMELQRWPQEGINQAYVAKNGIICGDQSCSVEHHV